MSWDFTGSVGLGALNQTLSLNAFTAAAWIKRTAGQTFTAFQQFIDASGNKFFGQIWDASQVYDRVNGGGQTNDIDSAAVLTLDTWMFVCFRYTGGLTGTLKTRVNSSSATPTGAGMSTGWPPSQPLHIGFGGYWDAAGSTWTKSATCKMAHMAYWNIALADADTDTLYSGGAGGGGANPESVQAANLAEYWYNSKTGRKSGIVLVDQGGTLGAYDSDNPTVDAPSGGGGGGSSPRGLMMMGLGD